MNSALMQNMLAAMSPGGLPAGFNMADKLSELAATNPAMAPIVRQLQERLATSPSQMTVDVQAEEEDSEPDQQAVAEDQQIRKQYKKLKSLAKGMFDELKTLRARNDMLATALGACHLCWGDDHECAFCLGGGQPGAYLVNNDVFDQVVGPALQQLKQRPPLVGSKTKNTGEKYAI